jgi:hypothetical protein
MKKIVTAAALSAVLMLAAGSAFAEELWNPHLRGTNEGLAAGALPPQGVYFINDGYFVTWKSTDASGRTTGEKLNAYIDIPIVMWVPGIKIFGADYAVAIAQPFDYTSVTADGLPGNGHTGTYNTAVIPGQLSWALPYDFHVKTGLGIYVDDASSSSARPAPSGGAGAGNSFWTVEPQLGVSWLHNGWNLSADIMYDYNFHDESTDYNSGNEIVADYTATKTIGKWTGGIGGYSQNQLERDHSSRCSATVNCGIRAAYGIGPIVGYDFGPVSVQGTFNYAITTHNDFGGDFLNIRVVAPLY